MLESNWRKWHRRVGVCIALFVAVQAVTGLFLGAAGSGSPEISARGKMIPGGTHGEGHVSEWHEAAEFIHHGGGLSLGVYRLLVGAGLLFMAGSGTRVWFLIRARSRKG